MGIYIDEEDDDGDDKHRNYRSTGLLLWKIIETVLITGRKLLSI